MTRAEGKGHRAQVRSALARDLSLLLSARVLGLKGNEEMARSAHQTSALCPWPCALLVRPR
jgi:hypothetical protein